MSKLRIYEEDAVTSRREARKASILQQIEYRKLDVRELVHDLTMLAINKKVILKRMDKIYRIIHELKEKLNNV